MSLNKLTDSTVEKKWMNIGCNDIKCETLSVSGGTTMTGPFNITLDNAEQCFIQGPSGTFVTQLTLNNTSPDTPGGFFSAIGCVNAYGGLKLGQSMDSTTPTSIILSDNKMSIRTFGVLSIDVSPNGVVAMTATTIGVNVVNPLTVTNQPYLERSLFANLPIGDSVLTPLAGLTLTSRDVGGLTYNSLSGVFQVPRTGVYNVSYSLDWELGGAPGTANYLTYIDVSGGNTYGKLNYSTTFNNTNASSGSASIYLTASSQFQITVQQKTGAPTNITSARVTVYQQS